MKDKNISSCKRNRTPRTAPLLADATQRVRITHPFHPLFSHEYRLLEYRRAWGREQAVFYDENEELIAVPVDWTDLAGATDPFVALSEGRALARPLELLELWALIEELRE